MAELLPTGLSFGMFRPPRARRRGRNRTFIHWNDATNDQFVARWPQGIEFVRRGTWATSQGPPQPISDLLIE